MEITRDSIIGDLVSDNYKSADVFNNHKIDFCCQGNRSLQDAATEAKIEVDNLISELKEIQNEPSGDHIDYRQWPMDLIVDYIEKKHHRYVEKQIPVIKPMLEKITQVHGGQHPELHRIKELFDKTAGKMTMHMKREELTLFPHIKRLVKAKESNQPFKRAAFGEVEKPIAKFMEEHEDDGLRFREINDLSKGYTLPEDACNSYTVTYKWLQEFEQDLHRHIHIENNILFPSAIKLENELTPAE